MILKYLCGASCTLCTKLLLLSKMSQFSYIWFPLTIEYGMLLKETEDFLAAFWNKGRLAFKCICLILVLWLVLNIMLLGMDSLYKYPCLASLFVPLYYLYALLYCMLVSEIITEMFLKNCFTSILVLVYNVQ